MCHRVLCWVPSALLPRALSHSTQPPPGVRLVSRPVPRRTMVPIRCSSRPQTSLLPWEMSMIASSSMLWLTPITDLSLLGSIRRSVAPYGTSFCCLDGSAGQQFLVNLGVIKKIFHHVPYLFFSLMNIRHSFCVLTLNSSISGLSCLFLRFLPFVRPGSSPLRTLRLGDPGGPHSACLCARSILSMLYLSMTILGAGNPPKNSTGKRLQRGRGGW